MHSKSDNTNFLARDFLFHSSVPPFRHTAFLPSFFPSSNRNGREKIIGLLPPSLHGEAAAARIGGRALRGITHKKAATLRVEGERVCVRASGGGGGGKRDTVRFSMTARKRRRRGKKRDTGTKEEKAAACVSVCACARSQCYPLFVDAKTCRTEKKMFLKGTSLV